MSGIVTKNKLLIWLLLYASGGTRSDNVCSIVALDVLMLFSWLDLRLCTNRTHIHRVYWHEGKSLKHGFRTYSWTAAAVLLLCTDFVTAPTPRAHAWYIQSAQTYAYTQKHPLLLSQSRELTARLLLYRDCQEY